MAMAADTVIAESQEIVPVGVIAPDDDAGRADRPPDCPGARSWMTRCSSRSGSPPELRPGYLVNLGIGLPTLVACELKQLQEENARLKHLVAELSLDKAIFAQRPERTPRQPA